MSMYGSGRAMWYPGRGLFLLCSAVVGDGGGFQVAVGRSTHLTSVGVIRKIKKFIWGGTVGVSYLLSGHTELYLRVALENRSNKLIVCWFVTVVGKLCVAHSCISHRENCKLGVLSVVYIQCDFWNFMYLT